MKIKLNNKVPKEEVIKEVEDIIKESTKEDKIVAVPTIKEVINKSLIDLENHEVSTKNVEDQTDKIIEKVHQSAVMHTVQNSEEVQKKVLESAEKQVLSSIDIKRDKQMLKVVQASYDANKDACENLGLSDEGRPMWQIRVAKVINNFWFIVWAIISSLTLTPVIFFLKRIGTQVKSAKLTWILTTIFYLLILFLLFLIVASIWKASGNAPDWIVDFLGGNKK